MSLGAALLCVGSLGWAVGGLQPEKSRVIFRSTDKEASISFANHSADALLVQAWVDDGVSGLNEAKKPSSYVLTPPVFQVGPGQAQVVRIFRVNAALPKDRESVSYLNVLYINKMPKARADGEVDEMSHGGIRLSVRHRIKIFHRPAGLRATDVDPGAPVVRARLMVGAKPALQLSNPTPFYVSLAGHAELRDGAGDALQVLEGMLAPFETRSVEVSRPAKSGQAWRQLHYRVVNDYGGTEDFTQAIE